MAGHTDTDEAVADPSIVRAGGRWVVYSTQRLTDGVATEHVPIETSSDLNTWANAGDALPVLPPWAVAGGTWAPSVIGLSDGTYRLYFAALSTSGHECIGVAAATSALGPFTSSAAMPLECQPTLGGSIDPDVFADGNGQRWLTWKNDGNSVGQSDQLWSQELTADGMILMGSPNVLLEASARWEHGVIENPDLVTLGGQLFLFYSGGNYASTSYATGYAACASAAGPCLKATTSKPIAPNSWAVGNGSLSTFALPDGRTGIAWSAWLASQVGAPGSSRSLFIGHIHMASGVPQLVGGLAADAPAPTVPTTPTSVAGTVHPSSAVRVTPIASGRRSQTSFEWCDALTVAAACALVAALAVRTRRRARLAVAGASVRRVETGSVASDSVAEWPDPAEPVPLKEPVSVGPGSAT